MVLVVVVVFVVVVVVRDGQSPVRRGQCNIKITQLLELILNRPGHG